MKKLLLTAMVFCSLAMPTSSSAVSAGDIAYRTGAGLGGLACLNAACSVGFDALDDGLWSLVQLQSGSIPYALKNSGHCFKNAILSAGFVYLGYRCFKAVCCQTEPDVVENNDTTQINN